jgi:hypothetical protein
MVRGAIVFTLSSLGGFALSAWPFFVWTEHYLLSRLILCCALGSIPTLTAAVYGTRRFGLPAAVGFFACALATAVFLYVRLSEMELAWAAQRIPRIDYPPAFLWIIPFAWILLSATVIAASWPVSANRSKDS